MSETRLMQVLLRPHVTEKAALIRENGQLIFRVLSDATKSEIAAAVELMFEVKVKTVQTSNVKGKTRKVRQGTRTQTGNNLFFAQRLAFKVLIHQVIVGFCCGFNHFFAPFGSKIGHVFRDVFRIVSHTLVFFVPVDGTHTNQVNDTLEIIFGTNSQLNRYWVTTQATFNLLNYTQEVCTSTIHLINKGHAWNLILIGLAPDCFRLRLNTTYCTKNGASTVKHAQRALDFNSKINVTRSINDVNSMLWILLIHTTPEGSRRSRSNGNTSLLLLLHPVHGRGTVVHFTNFV